jgi:hypothetical protein
MSSKELEASSILLAERLTSSWVKLLWANSLSERTTIDWDVLPETISFYVGKWYLNLSSAWSIYAKVWWKNVWIWYFDEWSIKFKPEATWIIADIVKYQGEKVTVASAK